MFSFFMYLKCFIFFIPYPTIFNGPFDFRSYYCGRKNVKSQCIGVRKTGSNSGAAYHEVYWTWPTSKCCEIVGMLYWERCVHFWLSHIQGNTIISDVIYQKGIVVDYSSLFLNFQILYMLLWNMWTGVLYKAC